MRIISLLTVPRVVAVCFFLLIVLTTGRYGFYGDELYYIACSKHLDFGYVDHPPLVALVAFISRSVFGETLIGLRVISGLAGAITVLLTAEIARRLGGTPYAQGLASISILAAPAFPALSSFFSMNAIDITLVSLFVVLFMRAIDTRDPWRWISVGIVGGIGALNKYTFLVLAGSVLLSTILTRRWTLLGNPWFSVSGAVALLVFSPHLVWQFEHGWLTLEFMRNATQYKNLSLSLIEFVGQLTIGLNPFMLPLWLLGLGTLLFSKMLKSFRYLGWTILIFLAVYGSQNSKFYYVVPVIPLLLSAGAVQFERIVRRASGSWVRRLVPIPLVLSGLILLPLAVPLLSPDRFVSYSKSLGLWNAIRMERWEGDTLPLHFLFRFGWDELVAVVARTYRALPPEEREQCIILGSWYASAAAVDYFGPAHGLPRAYSPHNSYWLWGPTDGVVRTVLAIGFDPRQLEEYFESVELVETFTHPYALSQPMYVCRNLRGPIDEIWKSLRSFG